MDLIIKNLERLKDYSNGNHKPIERVVVDFDKLTTEDFTQLFFSACEKYNDETEEEHSSCKNCKRLFFDACEKYDKIEEGCLLCRNCKHQFLEDYKDPCRACLASKEIRPNWEPKEPTLEEATEHMQSEFDATGNDVRVFMNERRKFK